MAAFLVPAAAATASQLSACNASSIYCGSNQITYFAEAGETNNVTVDRSGDNVVVTDTGAVITLFSNNAGCTVSPDQHQATCSLPAANGTYVQAYLEDGNDTFVSNLTGSGPPNGTFASTFVSGAAGNDTLTGNDTEFGNDDLLGGTGDDTLRGRGGDDSLRDVDFSEDTNPDTLPAGGANHFFGGPGNDFLMGGPGADELRGEAGDDGFRGDYFTGFQTGPNTATIFADKGNDVIDGGDGFDSVDYELPPFFNTTTGEFEDQPPTTPGATINLPDAGATTSNSGLAGEADSLTSIEDASGTEGADTINGSNLGNFLSGDGGNDAITGNRGPDSLSGGDGDDGINAQDGEADRVFCGNQAGDKANIDQFDATSGCPAVGAGTAVAVIQPPNIDKSAPAFKGVKTPKKVKAKTLKKKGYKLTAGTTDTDTVRLIATLTSKVGKVAIRSTAGEVILAEKRRSFKNKVTMTLKIAKGPLNRAIKKGKKMRLLLQLTDQSGNTTARRVVIKIT
jgi:Ca2+-binding RTX toxin-like protein